MIASGRLSTPTSRHVLAFTLAAFIDLIVFLLAYASGPFFFGAPGRALGEGGRRARRGGRAGLRPRPAAQGLGERSGLAHVEAAALSHGERQLVLLLASRGLATPVEEEGRRFHLLDASVHRTLAESLSERRLPLRAAATQPVGS